MKAPLTPMSTLKSAKTTIWTVGYDDEVRKIFSSIFDEDKSRDQKVFYITAVAASLYERRNENHW